MAKPIELGLELEGQDAKDFDEYLANPTTTQEGKEVLDESKRRYKQRKSEFNLGLVLEGQDAIDFHEYMENPTDTPEGHALIQEAKRLVEIDDVVKQLQPLLIKLAFLYRDTNQEKASLQRKIIELQYQLAKLSDKI